MENAKKNLVFHFGVWRQASPFQIGYVKRPSIYNVGKFSHFFDPHPPTVACFLVLSVGKFGKFLTPPPLEHADVLNGWSHTLLSLLRIFMKQMLILFGHLLWHLIFIQKLSDKEKKVPFNLFFLQPPVCTLFKNDSTSRLISRNFFLHRELNCIILSG